jgi:hypothetical protein
MLTTFFLMIMKSRLYAAHAERLRFARKRRSLTEPCSGNPVKARSKERSRRIVGGRQLIRFPVFLPVAAWRACAE